MTPRQSYRTHETDPAIQAPPKGRLSVFARTDRGGRTRNQDAFLVADLSTGHTGLGPEVATHEIGERGSLLLISDGTGERGEVASEMAVTTFHRVLGVMSSDLSPAERLRQAAHHTAKHLHNRLRRRFGRPAGATLTAVLIHGNAAHVAQIGDSRAYLVRGERIEQITKDQTLAQALVDAGAIEPGRPNARPPDLMLQSLGPDPAVRAVITNIDVRAGDVVIVCSDGLSNAVDATTMRDVVRSVSELADACRQLTALAVARGGDNATVLLARVEAVAHEVAPSEAITWTLPESLTREC